MRQTDVRSQLDTAFGNVESALRSLSDRLDDVLPDHGHRHPVERAGRAVRRTASQLAERVRPGHAGSLVEDTRRTAREHPVGTVLTAVAAGFLVWSVFRMTNSGHARHEGRSTLAGRVRAAQGDESVLRH